MNIIRKQEFAIEDMNDIRVGDQIQIGKYSATCQKVTVEGAIFFLDQYLDKSYQMNLTDFNIGGYDSSILRANLNEDFTTDTNFDSIRDKLLPVYNTDLVRIPTVGEIIGPDDFYEMDNAKQWELMKSHKNRITEYEDEKCEYGWFQNKVKYSTTDFACVNNYVGFADYAGASNSFGVRPIFMLMK